MTDDPHWDEVPDPPLHYDRLGVPISLREWSELVEDQEYKVIAQDLIGGRFLVSTVWLGIDYSIPWPGHTHIPIIYETMVFDHGRDGSDPRDDLEMRRYHSEDAARLGHAEMVALVAAVSDCGANASEQENVDAPER